MPRKKKFPVAIKSGSCEVKIYRDRNYYRVSYYLGGKRHRQIFGDLEEAEAEATAKAKQLAQGDIDAAQLTGRDRLAYGRALDAIRLLGVSLEAAALEYAEAKKMLLQGHSLAEAAAFYMRHHGQGITGKLVLEAVEAFKAEKQQEGRSRVYLGDLRYRLDGFGKAFNVEVRQLTPADVRDFLNGLKFSARSFNNHRRTLQTFFRFCQAHGWLSKETDLLERVGKRKEIEREIEIFTPEELRKLLAVAPRWVATCIALQAFAGIRTAELLRLTWKDLERCKGYIEIAAGKAKSASRRLIPVCDNLVEWLHQADRQGERVWPAAASEYYSQQARAADTAGITWKANALRHSFFSYRVARIKDVAEVAFEGGNSPTIVYRHYRALVTEAAAKEWFGIMPDQVAANVVPFAA